MGFSTTHLTLILILGVLVLARPAHAFGAGNIGSTSKIEGENWRHGDLEDVLLTLVASRAMGGKKFSKLDVKRIYFGNWLRDYSQAVDVGTVKHVSAEAIRILLWVLGFMSLGYGTAEFEVTSERLGCYRPEEHIDNPKDYADNEDARAYDRRLRGPVDERRELSIDPELGMKSYIASESLGITTSAGLVRHLFGRSIQLGRQYARSHNKADLYEALRLMGTGCHCLEDFSAHSNYVELALAELGEQGVFPHVGRNTQIRLRGASHPVYPIVTGTFGGVDFLHSVTGEFDDKATQSEIQELEGTLQNAQNSGQNPSVLQSLLSKLPSGIFGGGDSAGKMDELQQNAVQHQMQHTQVSPRQPEEWLRYLTDTQKQIYPILEWHDRLMKGISEAIEQIPILPDLIEQVQDQVNMFVFSLLAPFVLPIINQVKSELNTGSSTIIQSSEDKQHIVFHDDHSSDPTHSMLSKDHFSNILNEPAGKVAGACLRWIVPQLMAAWDDERIDADRTINRIIRGVLHHPALRDHGDDGAADGRRIMFGVVEGWWRNKSEAEREELRQQLSRQGVQSGRNHKPGVHDHGHGSAAKLGMPNMFAAGAAGNGGYGGQAVDQLGKIAGDAVGGGTLGSLVSGLAGSVGGGVLGSLIGDSSTAQTYQQAGYGNDGSRVFTTTQVSGGESVYKQDQYTRVEGPHGEHNEQVSHYQQQQNGGQWQSQVRQERRSSNQNGYQSESRFESQTTATGYGRRQESNFNPDGDYDNHRDNRYDHTQRQRNHHSESNGDTYGRSSYNGEYQRPQAERDDYDRRNYDNAPSTWERTPRDFNEKEQFEESYNRSQRSEHNSRNSFREDQTSTWERPPQEHFGQRSRYDEETREGYRNGFGSQGRDEYREGPPGGFGREEYGGRDRDDYGDKYGRHHRHYENGEYGEGERYGEEQTNTWAQESRW